MKHFTDLRTNNDIFLRWEPIMKLWDIKEKQFPGR